MIWTEEAIKEKITLVTKRDDITDNNADLIESGINSLQVMKLAGIFRRSGRKVSFARLMENRTVSAWCRLLSDADDASVKAAAVNDTVSDIAANDECDLTDVQYSYWVGRGNEQPMGGVDCHAYYEFAGGAIDQNRLEKAWRKLFKCHPMLRTRITGSGKQVVMDAPYHDTFHVIDLRAVDEEAAEKELAAVRGRISHRTLDIANGESAGLTLCILSEDKSLVIIDAALIFCDVQSIKILLRDLADLYAGKSDSAAANKNWSFGAYLKNISEERKSEEQEAEAYWKGRTETLPLRPELPLAVKPESITSPVYTHRTHIFSSGQWRSICSKAAASGVTGAMFLLTAYSKLISRWSTAKRFLINIPLFDRSEEYNGIRDVIADFTTLLLSEQDYTVRRSFLEDMRAVSTQFIKDMHYAAYSGVKVQRDLQKKYPGQRDFAPVVFACNIGMDLISDTFEENIGKLHYMVSQTPQVWIDCQIFERNGALHVSWDTADALFYAGMPDEMFRAFIVYLEKLAAPETDLSHVIEPELPQNVVRKNVAETVKEYPDRSQTLTCALIQRAETEADKTAAVECGSGVSFTWGELYRRSSSIASALINRGFKSGDRAAVILPRGIGQIAAIYGILLAGGVYVPLSYDQPAGRLERIFASLGLHYAVTDDGSVPVEKTAVTCIKYGDIPDADEFVSAAVDPSAAAYIIMTSGSTGIPKGVEISHESAMNTIIDVNRRNGIKSGAGYLGVSAIDFDLSVYDIFGSANAGGVLYVLPSELAKDAEYWSELVENGKITVWNSVPVLFDMLITASSQKNKDISGLRNVMLSGDWVSASLIKRARALLHNTRIIAMGGATEASIWSNECVIPETMPKEWINIPYGKALSGQIYRVVDTCGNDCPDLVEGELVIGGFGVAIGYAGAPELTEQKFFEQDGIRWYRTGDMGRFLKDGTIEFLGRRDLQVKVRGHRIELGEIEAAAKCIRGISSAAALIYESSGCDRQIVLCYTSENGADIDRESMQTVLSAKLPSYMMPADIARLERFPLTSNGKIDRKRIVIPERNDENASAYEELSDTEKRLKAIWAENLGGDAADAIMRRSDYFELGGNSLLATKLIYAVEKEFGTKLKISAVFRTPSLYEMAEKIDKLKREEDNK